MRNQTFLYKLTLNKNKYNSKRGIKVDKASIEHEFTVFIGKKDTKIYVFSVLKQAETNDRILLRARGGYAISRAVNVSQIIVNRSLKNWKLGEVKIGSDKIEKNPEGEELAEELKDQYVSTICIELLKGVEESS